MLAAYPSSISEDPRGNHRGTDALAQEAFNVADAMLRESSNG